VVTVTNVGRPCPRGAHDRAQDDGVVVDVQRAHLVWRGETRAPRTQACAPGRRQRQRGAGRALVRAVTRAPGSLCRRSTRVMVVMLLVMRSASETMIAPR